VDLELVERLPDSDTGRPPVLMVHGLGHGSWCWEHWLDGVAAAGHPAYAVSLRGHAGSSGRLRTARLSHYVDDVVRTALGLPRPAVLVGHSMGGLVVTRALARYAARAGVLVAPVPAQPAVHAYLRLLRRHPADALGMLAGRSLPMRPEYLFRELDADEAARHSGRCGEESALAQYQLIFHRPAPQPLGGAPVLVLESPDDEVLPASSIRATARRYGAELVEFPGMGHDLMLDARWKQPLQAMLDWLDRVVSRA
jgi:pimeloyl-ACP methyl ester carboxylesterase